MRNTGLFKYTKHRRGKDESYLTTGDGAEKLAENQKRVIAGNMKVVEEASPGFVKTAFQEAGVSSQQLQAIDPENAIRRIQAVSNSLLQGVLKICVDSILTDKEDCVDKTQKLFHQLDRNLAREKEYDAALASLPSGEAPPSFDAFIHGTKLINKKFFNKYSSLQFIKLFEKIREHGDLAQLHTICVDSQTLAPQCMREALRKWLKTHPEYAAEFVKPPEMDSAAAPPASETPATNAIPTPQTPPASNGITIIELDHPAVLPDKSDEHISAVHGVGQEPEIREEQGRRDAIVQALIKDGINASDIRVYVEKIGEARSKYPYELIEIKQGEACQQIAVCDWKGFSTYVMKKPYLIDAQNMIKISELKDDPAAFKISRISEEQWLTDIREKLYTPLDKLDTQLKHTLSWKYMSALAQQSFIAYIIRERQLPRTVDTRPIVHGPLGLLQHQTTWSRFNDALYKGSIAGLEGIRTFHELYERLKASNPDIESFIGAQPISLKQVFDDSARIIHAFDAVPQKALYEDMKTVEIAGHTPAQIALAFQYHAIVGYDDASPPDYEEYLIASNLAVRGQDGWLEPANTAAVA